MINDPKLLDDSHRYVVSLNNWNCLTTQPRNVFHTIDFLLQYSAVVREKVHRTFSRDSPTWFFVGNQDILAKLLVKICQVASGEVDIQGGVYNLETGDLEMETETETETETVLFRELERPIKKFWLPNCWLFVDGFIWIQMDSDGFMMMETWYRFYALQFG